MSEDGMSDGTPRVSDDRFLAVLRDAESPVLTTSEVAERLPVGRRTVLRRLKRLHNDGRIERKPVGGRAQVWWVSERDDPSTVDPLFDAPAFSVERPVDETAIDDVLYER
jgi:predicted ArsR family transcriptional regulator